jgi:hypothetical protein
LKRIIQLVRLVTLGSQVRSVFRIIWRTTKENRHWLVPVFIAGAGFEPATFGLWVSVLDRWLSSFRHQS